jgi:hypothetical protein
VNRSRAMEPTGKIVNLEPLRRKHEA